MKKYYSSICLICKDENFYISEFIEYHLSIGFDHIYIYDNGSKIPLKNEVNIYEDKITIIDWSHDIYDGKQNRAYDDCLNKFRHESYWIAFIDTDEFICINSNKLVSEFLKEYENYGGLGINWQMFGSNNIFNKTKNVLQNYTKKADINYPPNKHIKTIVNTDKTIKCTLPHNFIYINDYYCVNENFNIIYGPFSEVSVNKIQINHYYCKSKEEFQEKINRGRGDNNTKRSINEFIDFDNVANVIEDLKILNVKTK